MTSLDPFYTTPWDTNEQGLRSVIAAPRAGAGFRLLRLTFRGRGLRPEAAAPGWSRPKG